MTADEKKILEVFKDIIPKLTERDKEKLLWLGEGIALKTSELEKEIA